MVLKFLNQRAQSTWPQLFLCVWVFVFSLLPHNPHSGLCLEPRKVKAILKIALLYNL